MDCKLDCTKLQKIGLEKEWFFEWTKYQPEVSAKYDFLTSFINICLWICQQIWQGTNKEIYKRLLERMNIISERCWQVILGLTVVCSHVLRPWHIALVAGLVLLKRHYHIQIYYNLSFSVSLTYFFNSTIFPFEKVNKLGVGVRPSG